jgi:hypothetical protein
MIRVLSRVCSQKCTCTVPYQVSITTSTVHVATDAVQVHHTFEGTFLRLISNVKAPEFVILELMRSRLPDFAEKMARLDSIALRCTARKSTLQPDGPTSEKNWTVTRRHGRASRKNLSIPSQQALQHGALQRPHFPKRYAALRSGRVRSL